jgi:hypothetical protein
MFQGNQLLPESDKKSFCINNLNETLTELERGQGSYQVTSNFFDASWTLSRGHGLLWRSGLKGNFRAF